MIKKIKIKNFKATIVLRHRWEKGSKSMLQNYEANQIRTNLQIGIWLKQNKVVGPVKKTNNKADIKKTFSSDNFINNYMLGLNLIVCKCWIDFNFKPIFGM